MKDGIFKARFNPVPALVLILVACPLLLGLICICPPPPPECETDADCDDCQFCTGEETCVDGECQEGTNPCAEGEICDEEIDVCVGEEPECEENADCDDGLFCNGAETCVDGECQEGEYPCAIGQICNEETDACEPGPVTGCTSDDDCDEGEFCDIVSGECVEGQNPYTETAFDHDFHSDTLSLDCTNCHHDGAGFTSCSDCHDRDEVVAGMSVLKDVMHNPDTGCRSCHAGETDDGLWDCTKCHTGLGDL